MHSVEQCAQRERVIHTLTSWPPCHRGPTSQSRPADLRAFAMPPHSRHSDTIDLDKSTTRQMTLAGIRAPEIFLILQPRLDQMDPDGGELDRGGACTVISSETLGF